MSIVEFTVSRWKCICKQKINKMCFKIFYLFIKSGVLWFQNKLLINILISLQIKFIT